MRIYVQMLALHGEPRLCPQGSRYWLQSEGLMVFWGSDGEPGWGWRMKLTAKSEPLRFKLRLGRWDQWAFAKAGVRPASIDVPRTDCPEDSRPLSQDSSLWPKTLSIFWTRESVCIGLQDPAWVSAQGTGGDSAGAAGSEEVCWGGSVLLRAHSLWPACHSALHPWQVEARTRVPTSTTHWEGRGGLCWAHRGPQESKRKPVQSRSQPSWGSLKEGRTPSGRLCPAPTCPHAPTDLATGPGPRVTRAFTLSLLLAHRHLRGHPGLPGRWMFQGSAQTGTGFQSVSLDVKVSPVAQTPSRGATDTCGLGGRRGPRLDYHIAREQSLSGCESSLWPVRGRVRGPRGQECSPQPQVQKHRAAVSGAPVMCPQGDWPPKQAGRWGSLRRPGNGVTRPGHPSPPSPFLPFIQQPLQRAQHFQNKGLSSTLAPQDDT